jgi:hypothetical protein
MGLFLEQERTVEYSDASGHAGIRITHQGFPPLAVATDKGKQASRGDPLLGNTPAIGSFLTKSGTAEQ